MNVKELIQELEKIENKELPVCTSDYEYGTEEADGISKSTIYSYSLKKTIDVIVIS